MINATTAAIVLLLHTCSTSSSPLHNRLIVKLYSLQHHQCNPHLLERIRRSSSVAATIPRTLFGSHSEKKQEAGRYVLYDYLRRISSSMRKAN
eukprot:scaffold11355_cov81-Skeletonema_marinoi.AAC.2